MLASKMRRLKMQTGAGQSCSTALLAMMEGLKTSSPNCSSTSFLEVTTVRNNYQISEIMNPKPKEKRIIQIFSYLQETIF